MADLSVYQRCFVYLLRKVKETAVKSRDSTDETRYSMTLELCLDALEISNIALFTVMGLK